MSVDVQASSTATSASATRTAAPSKTEMLKQAALSPLSLLSLLPIPTPQQLLLHTLSLGPIPRHIAFVMDATVAGHARPNTPSSRVT